MSREFGTGSNCALDRVWLDLNTVSSIEFGFRVFGEGIGKETAKGEGYRRAKSEGGGEGEGKRRYAGAKGKGITNAGRRRSKSGLERVEFRECSNWIRETEGKAAMRRYGGGTQGARRKKRETEENGLNEMRHSLFSEYYKVCRRDFSRRNGERRVILSALFISAAFNDYDGLSSEHRSSVSLYLKKQLH